MGIRKGSDALKAQLDSTIIRLKDEGKIDEFMNRACEIAANKCQRGRSITKYPFCRIIHLGGLSCTLLGQSAALKSRRRATFHETQL